MPVTLNDAYEATVTLANGAVIRTPTSSYLTRGQCERWFREMATAGDKVTITRVMTQEVVYESTKEI